MEASLGVLEASWAVLAPSWASWGYLGGFLDTLGSLLGRLGGLLRRLGDLLGRLGAVWKRTRASWAVLGSKTALRQPKRNPPAAGKAPLMSLPPPDLPLINKFSLRANRRRPSRALRDISRFPSSASGRWSSDTEPSPSRPPPYKQVFPPGRETTSIASSSRHIALPVIRQRPIKLEPRAIPPQTPPL